MRILLPRMHFSLLILSLVVAVVVVVVVVVVVLAVVVVAVVYSSSGGGGASDSDINSTRSCGSSKILTWTGKCKPGAIEGAWDGKYTLGTRAGK